MAPGWWSGHPDGLDDAALKTLVAAFESVGIKFHTEDEGRLQLLVLAQFSRSPPTELRLADPKSVELVERLADAAHELRLAVEAVVARADEIMDRPESDRVDVCQFVFPEDEAVDELRYTLLTLEAQARGARQWTVQPSRGRPPLLLFHEFARRISDLYVERIGSRGFSESNGSAVGPLVNLIHEAQQILPHQYRHADVRTTGKRLLAALAAENGKNPPIFW